VLRLNTRWFSTLADAKQKIEAWRNDYNECRLHQALNNLMPLEYKEKQL
jgi:putative transposase